MKPRLAYFRHILSSILRNVFRNGYFHCFSEKLSVIDFHNFRFQSIWLHSVSFPLLITLSPTFMTAARPQRDRIAATVICCLVQNMFLKIASRHRKPTALAESHFPFARPCKTSATGPRPARESVRR